MGYEKFIFGFRSPQQQFDMLARSKNTLIFL